MKKEKDIRFYRTKQQIMNALLQFIENKKL